MNPTALVSASGSVVERYLYDPYGKVKVLNPDWSDDENGESDFGNEVLYAGYRLDPESGLYHVRRRSYHPTLGRWLSRDPAGYQDGMNLYEYVRGRPVAAQDATGLLDPDSPAATEPMPTPLLERIISWLFGSKEEQERRAQLAQRKEEWRKRVSEVESRVMEELKVGGPSEMPEVGVRPFDEVDPVVRARVTEWEMAEAWRRPPRPGMTREQEADLEMYHALGARRWMMRKMDWSFAEIAAWQKRGAGEPFFVPALRDLKVWAALERAAPYHSFMETANILAGGKVWAHVRLEAAAGLQGRFSPKVLQVGKDIRGWLGEDYAIMRHDQQGFVAESADHMCKFRMDFAPAKDLPHAHLEVFDPQSGLWLDATDAHRLYFGGK